MLSRYVDVLNLWLFLQMNLLELRHLEIKFRIVLPKLCSLWDLIESVLEFQLWEIVVKMRRSLRLVVKVSDACIMIGLQKFLSFRNLLLIYFLDLLNILE